MKLIDIIILAICCGLFCAVCDGKRLNGDEGTKRSIRTSTSKKMDLSLGEMLAKNGQTQTFTASVPLKAGARSSLPHVTVSPILC